MISSFLSYRRVVGITYLCIITILCNIVIKHLINLFVIFCVVYTITDLYKKRKKYLWIIRFVNGNLRFITYTVIGEENLNSILCIKQKKQKRKFEKH